MARIVRAFTIVFFDVVFSFRGLVVMGVYLKFVIFVFLRFFGLHRQVAAKVCIWICTFILVRFFSCEHATSAVF